MVPQHTMWCSMLLPSRMLLACLSIALVTGAWWIAYGGNRGLPERELVDLGMVRAAITGPGPIPTQLADRSTGGGGSASLAIAKLRGGSGVVARVALSLADSPCLSSVHPAAIPMAHLPWVLILSVCLLV